MTMENVGDENHCSIIYTKPKNNLVNINIKLIKTQSEPGEKTQSNTSIIKYLKIKGFHCGFRRKILYF